MGRSSSPTCFKGWAEGDLSGAGWMLLERRDSQPKEGETGGEHGTETEFGVGELWEEALFPISMV